MTGRPAVIVVGSVNVDVVWHLPTLPAPGQTVSGGSHHELPGGKGANQAVAAARLGARTHLVARVGDDAHGRWALDDLRAEDVCTEHVHATLGVRTGLAAVLVDHASENLIGVSSGANHRLAPEDVVAAFDQIRLEHAVVVASLEVPDESVLTAARQARQRGWRFVLNPAPAHPLEPDLVRLVSVLTPNAHEVGVVGADGSEELLARGVGAVLTTRGAAGVEVAVAGSAPLTLPGLSVPAVDTTGAGDTFTGALARALARGADLVAAARYANAAAALSTLGRGARAAMPRHEAVQRALATPR
ncbi:ribokinase [Pseudonocardia sp.]|uniref:ribokinase n=1 Tax=Pseudonocardia sp. TaxID=60912 RepID=UPI0031FD8FB4